ncbi:hypothetical protein ABPG72_018140 [Tetrahymena utriculariae]
MPLNSCLDQSSTLKTFSMDFQNTPISLSFVHHINDILLKVFIETQNLSIIQGQCKLQIESQDQNLKSFKFNYDSFKYEQFLDQTQSSENIFLKAKIKFKKAEIEHTE